MSRYRWWALGFALAVLASEVLPCGALSFSAVPTSPPELSAATFPALPIMIAACPCGCKPVPTASGYAPSKVGVVPDEVPELLALRFGVRLSPLEPAEPADPDTALEGPPPQRRS